MVIRHNFNATPVVAAIKIISFALSCLFVASCSEPSQSRIEPVYDPKTGLLQLLKYDANNDGKTDTWRYMDGALVTRIEVDRDQDGKIDRWEHYDTAQKLQNVGVSLANDGVEDAWTYFGADGAPIRTESSPRRNGKIERVEHFEHGVLSRAEEDSDGDGLNDKWETYNATRLVMVAFDTMRRGAPDRRLVYGDDGSARFEIDANGDGHFVPVEDSPAGRGARAQQ